MSTAHIRQLQVLLGDRLVGRLASSARGELFFQYDPAWLAEGFDIAPYTLSFDAAPQKATSLIFDGLHGPFYDSLPDGWGLLLMDRALKTVFDWPRHAITPLDRLAYLGHRAMGALRYVPDLALPLQAAQALDLASLAESAERVLEGEDGTVLGELLLHGGSPGGARPKVTVARHPADGRCMSGFQPLAPGFEQWMVKFHARHESPQSGRIEYVYSKMARLAGLTMPPTELIDVKVGQGTSQREEAFFAVQRFDREGEQRVHMLSLCSHLYATHRAPSVSYDTLLAATLRLTRAMPQVRQAFRLMVFNAVMHNRDDHSKNFAFVKQGDGWALSPAFDLTFSQGMGNQHSCDINGSGHPDRKDVLAVARNAGITDAPAIIEQVVQAASEWPRLAAEHGVGGEDAREIAAAIEEMRGRIG